MLLKRIAVCGMGPHTMKCHYAILEILSENHDISIELLIDLKSRRGSIEKYLAERKLKPEKCIYLDDISDNSLGTRLDPEAEKELNCLRQNGGIDKLLVSTEPKAHKIYVLWGLAHNVDVIVDKPLTANAIDSSDPSQSCFLIKDYEEISKAVDKSAGSLYVMVPKRKRECYSVIKNYTDDFVKRWEVPVTHIGLNINEGMWNMPDEFFTRENHPYKYGYGALLHSGYHYTDFMLWLLDSNNQIADFTADKLRISLMNTNPNDFVHQINRKFYTRHFGKDYSEYLNDQGYSQYSKMGELDIYMLLQAMNGQHCITSAELSILHTSFSSRSWTQLPENTYTDNGRVHHHNYLVQFGTLCSISSTQRSVPYELDRLDECSETSGDCVVEIFRNIDMIGGKPYEKIVYSKEINQQENGFHGKKAQIEDWLFGKDSVCEFKQHYKNVLMLQKLYECMAGTRNGSRPPYIEYPII